MHIPAKLSRYATVVTLLLRHRHLFNTSDASRQEGEALARDLEARGATFVKLGQLLSTRGDLLSPAYVDALARLQDRVAPFPFADVERTVEAELGVRISKAFGFFETEPIAAASLALRKEVVDQVSRFRHATLADLQVGKLLPDMNHVMAMHGVRPPSELAMLGKTLLSLDQVARCLAPGLDVNGTIRDEAMTLMRQRVTRSASTGGLLTTGLAMILFVMAATGGMLLALQILAHDRVRRRTPR